MKVSEQSFQRSLFLIPIIIIALDVVDDVARAAFPRDIGLQHLPDTHAHKDDNHTAKEIQHLVVQITSLGEIDSGHQLEE